MSIKTSFSVAFGVSQLLVLSASFAEEKMPTGNSIALRTFYQWNSINGSPIASASKYCGDSATNPDKRARDFTVNRDLGKGVNIRVGMSYEKEKPISATILFLYYDEKLTVLPDNIELHVLSDDKTYKPNKVKSIAYEPKDSSCAQFGEWIQLEFPVRSSMVENAELVFPPGTVSKGDILSVRPFGFKRITE